VKGHQVIGRRTALGLLLASGGAGLVAACSPPVAPTPPASTAAAGGPPPTPQATLVTSAVATPSGQPRTGGTLRTALTPDLANLEVHYILINQYENLWLTMDRLITYDDKLLASQD
jgi:hypothetical protein